jgi:hypothetical protein
MTHIDTSDIIRGSIWIRPTGEAMHRIDEAIRIVRQRIEGPPVKPHVSLLGGVEATQEQVQLRLRHLARQLRPFEIRLGRIDWRHEYYRAFFSVAELSHELAEAHRLAGEVFEMASSDAFEPHVSLAYGDLHEPLQKALAEQVGSLDVSFTAHAVGFANATGDRSITDWRVVFEETLGVR